MVLLVLYNHLHNVCAIFTGITTFMMRIKAYPIPAQRCPQAYLHGHCTCNVCAFRTHLPSNQMHRLCVSVGQTVAELMETPCNAFLVAEEANADGTLRIVGCVHVSWSGKTDSKDPGVDAHFGMLSVPKEYSKRGIGKLLVSSAGEECLLLIAMCPRSYRSAFSASLEPHY